MALIPVSYKLSFYDPSKSGGIITVQEDNANLATSLATQFSMQDVIDTVGGGATVYGTGTPDTIPLWITASEVGDSLLVSTSTGLGINMTAGAGASAMLTIHGGAASDVMQITSTGVSNNNMLTHTGGTPFGYFGNSCVIGQVVGEMGLRSNNDLLFSSGGSTEHMRLNSAGDLSIPVGGLTCLLGDITVSAGNLAVTTGGLSVGGTFSDSSGDVGVAGQVLSSTATGTDWITGGGTPILTNPGGLGTNVVPWTWGNLGAGGQEMLMVGTEIDLSLPAPWSGGANCAYGVDAGSKLENGAQHNTLIGRSAGNQISTGEYNVGVGPNSCGGMNFVPPHLPVIGTLNVAIGYYSMVRIQGNVGYNTAVGGESLAELDTGSKNTAIGCYAGDILTTGEENICIGFASDASTDVISNEVSIYNGSVIARFQGAAAAWTFVSDARDKKDIEDLELGVSFVNKLKPRKFKWDVRNSDVDKGKEASGFIAQEIQEVLDETNTNYTGIVDTNDPEKYQLAQSNIIPILVKAVQELSAKVEVLENKICENCSE